MSLYDIIGCSKDATPPELKKAYRARARELHPDQNRDDPNAGERMKILSRAYSILKDPDKRAKYDATGEEDDTAERPPAGLTSLSRAYEAVATEMEGPEGGLFAAITGRKKGSPRTFTTESLTEAIKGFLMAGKANAAVTTKEFRGELKVFEGQLKRLKNAPMLEGLLRGKIDQINRNMATVDAQVEDIEAALKMLEDAEYEVDAPDPAQRTEFLWPEQPPRMEDFIKHAGGPFTFRRPR